MPKAPSLMGDLPSIQEILDVWNIPDVPNKEAPDHFQENFNCQAYLLTWYLNEWIPSVVGNDWWSAQIRPYKFTTDKVEVEGAQKVLVTVTSEAFGLVQYENSRDKWIENFKYKEANGKRATVPMYNKNKPETHKFKAKWSDAKSGQCSGWHPGAFTMFQIRKGSIKEFRVQDEADDMIKQKFGQKMIRIAYKIEDNDDGTVEPAAKRARTESDEQEALAAVATKSVVTVEDE